MQKQKTTVDKTTGALLLEEGVPGKLPEKKVIKWRDTHSRQSQTSLLNLQIEPGENPYQHFRRLKKTGETILERAEEVKRLNGIQDKGKYYSNLKYLQKIPAMKRNPKFLAFLDWQDKNCIKGRATEELSERFKKGRFRALILHRLNQDDYKKVEKETGVKPRLARRYAELAVKAGIWKRLGNVPQRGFGILYVSGYFVEFKNPKTGKVGYKKVRLLRKQDKKTINELKNFKVEW